MGYFLWLNESISPINVAMEHVPVNETIMKIATIMFVQTNMIVFVTGT